MATIIFIGPPRRSFLVFLKNQAAIGPTETKAVGEDIFNLHRAGAQLSMQRRTLCGDGKPSRAAPIRRNCLRGKPGRSGRLPPRAASRQAAPRSGSLVEGRT